MTRKTIVGTVIVLVLAGLATLLFRSLIDRRTNPSADTPAAGRSSDSVPISAMLRDTVWQRRAAAAWGLTERTEIPTGRRASLLLEVLEREVVTPTVAPVRAGSWPPFTNYLRIHYLHALEILGADVQDVVRKAQQHSSGEVREWYTLALGSIVDPAAAPALREVLAHSRDPDVRMTAARYLGWLKDREAVPFLRAALADTAGAVPVSDIRGRRPKRFYPVREQAALALEELGMRIERRGDTFSVQ